MDQNNLTQYIPRVQAINQIIERVYPHQQLLGLNQEKKPDFISRRSISALTNDQVRGFNSQIKDALPNQPTVYISEDIHNSGDLYVDHIPPEVMHTFNCSSLPIAGLTLKGVTSHGSQKYIYI